MFFLLLLLILSCSDLYWTMFKLHQTSQFWEIKCLFCSPQFIYWIMLKSTLWVASFCLYLFLSYIKYPNIHNVYIYNYAFSRRFYPKRLTVHSGYTFFVSMCVPWELNPQPLLCQRNALPLSHRMPKPHFKGILKCSLYKEYIFCDYLYNIIIFII